MTGFDELADALVNLMKTVTLPNGKKAFTSVQKRVRSNFTGDRPCYIDLDGVTSYKEVLRNTTSFMDMHAVITVACREIKEEQEITDYLLVDQTLDTLRAHPTLDGLIRNMGLKNPYIQFKETVGAKKYFVGQIHLGINLQR